MEITDLQPAYAISVRRQGSEYPVVISSQTAFMMLQRNLAHRLARAKKKVVFGRSVAHNGNPTIRP